MGAWKGVCFSRKRPQSLLTLEGGGGWQCAVFHLHEHSTLVNAHSICSNSSAKVFGRISLLWMVRLIQFHGCIHRNRRRIDALETLGIQEFSLPSRILTTLESSQLLDIITKYVRRRSAHEVSPIFVGSTCEMGHQPTSRLPSKSRRFGGVDDLTSRSWYKKSNPVQLEVF